MKTVEIYTEAEDSTRDNRKETGRGIVKYDSSKQYVFVDFPDEEVKGKIMKYLNTLREYKIPESQGIDDFRTELKLPTESTMYLELALNALWAHTGVFVDWSTEKEE